MVQVKGPFVHGNSNVCAHADIDTDTHSLNYSLLSQICLPTNLFLIQI